MAAQHKFYPYRNEAECLQIGDLTIENRLDRVSLYGSLDITLDKEGLATAQALKDLLDATLAELAGTDLPDRIAIVASETVENPFL